MRERCGALGIAGLSKVLIDTPALNQKLNGPLAVIEIVQKNRRRVAGLMVEMRLATQLSFRRCSRALRRGARAAVLGSYDGSRRDRARMKVCSTRITLRA
jgi:hypothetical protein